MMRYLLTLGLLLFLNSASEALRFTHNPIQIDSGLLEIGSKSKLTCNYVRFRTESIRHITWRFEYNGVSGKFYDYHVATGAKEATYFPFISVPEDGEINEKEIEIILSDFRAPEIKFICEVDALRDNGYGKLHHSSKKAHGSVTVVDTSNWSLQVSPMPEHKRTIESRDESLAFKCISKGATPPPSLSFSIKGQNLTSFSTERAIVRHIYESQDENVIEGHLKDLSSDLFDQRSLVIKCYAKYGDSVLGKSELEMLVGRGRGGSVQPWKPEESDLGEREEEEKTLKKRFLAQSDPARSVHALVPHDYFDGYILVIADSLTPENEYVTPHVTLLGQLPNKVKNSLAESLYGRVNNLSPEKLMLKIDVANLLNMMGKMGYRVVSSTTSMSGSSNNKLIWTLERRKVSEPVYNREL